MKNRPIVLSTEAIRAILSGRKTQLRMPIKGVDSKNWISIGGGYAANVRDTEKTLDICPYGKPGDRLWVKEPRITLEVEHVRVQRLQEISRDDAIAEGIEANEDEGITYYGPYNAGHVDPEVAFSWLWDSANCGFPWASNPFVWAITFRVVK